MKLKKVQFINSVFFAAQQESTIYSNESPARITYDITLEDNVIHAKRADRDEDTVIIPITNVAAYVAATVVASKNKTK